MNNKIGSYNLYARFHLNVFSTQVRVFSYIPKRGRDKNSSGGPVSGFSVHI
jgi:hypothetical protein